MLVSTALLKNKLCGPKRNMYCYVVVIYAAIGTYTGVVTYAVSVTHAFIVISAVIVIYAVAFAICDRLSADQKDMHLLSPMCSLQRGGSCDEACAQS